MSKKAQADWLERYKASGHIYTQDKCGCVVFLMVDMEDEVKAAAKDLAAQVAKGREIKRAPKDGLPPHYCSAHDRTNIMCAHRFGL